MPRCSRRPRPHWRPWRWAAHTPSELRRAFLKREGRPATAQEVVGSTARAVGFGLQKAALRRTADNRLLARAARAYVARTSGRRTQIED